MHSVRPRRNFLKLASLLLPAPFLHVESALAALATPAQATAPAPPSVSDLFPTQPPELAREMVTVSHFNFKRVQELVDARPSLARAAWDWGFGDWETALGAASHMGNRPIAEYLIAKGARPSLFSSAMLGHLEVVKAFIAAQPGVQRIRGPHSIPLLAHAKAGGAAARPVFDFLQSLGDAGADPLAPLSDADAASITGSYTFGPAMNDQIDITFESYLGHPEPQIVFARKGMMGRPLCHLGDRVFYPVGASAVRIRFTQQDSAMLMTIEAPALVLGVRRSPKSS